MKDGTKFYRAVLGIVLSGLRGGAAARLEFKNQSVTGRSAGGADDGPAGLDALGAVIGASHGHQQKTPYPR
jgi:hypothetical protein